MSVIKKLEKQEIYKPPNGFATDVCYEVIMGSSAYGVSSNSSDIDIYAVCVPPQDIVFPHMVGHIRGFGDSPKNFEVTQQHHMMMGEKEYDIAIYSLIKYFALCADNNPNMVDSLFVPTRCITHIDNIGRIMRENRKLFLHKGAYHRFKGYAYAQMKKLKTKKPVGKRKELVDNFGYDTKFAYHLVRLTEECEQILMTHDLDLEKSREMLKAVRRGEWSFEQLEKWFENKVLLLDKLYITSTIQLKPDMGQLKNILLTCLEEKYGTLSANMVNTAESATALIKLEQIKQIIQKN